MLKSVLYYLLLITTSLRLVDVIYLLTATNSCLPGIVFAVTSAMILYGIVLVVKRFVGSVRLSQLMAFYLVQIFAILFNLIFVAVTLPVKVTLAETLVVGTFLDILINCVVVYLCMKQRRSRFITVGGL
ncbi:MAG: hypothetical protein ACOX0K_02000 [Oscillospiraceae bacterium]